MDTPETDSVNDSEWPPRRYVVGPCCTSSEFRVVGVGLPARGNPGKVVLSRWAMGETTIRSPRSGSLAPLVV